MGIPSKGVQRIAVEAVFLTLDFLVVGLRLWARSLKGKRLEINDYLIIVGLFFTACFCICGVIDVVLGRAGEHLWVVLETPGQGEHALTIFGQLNVAIDLLWIAAITTIKISILHLYIVLFANLWFRRAAYAVMGTCMVCGVVFVGEIFFICRPFAFNWNKSISGTCGDQKLKYIVAGFINLFLDIVILSLPMPFLWGLQIPFRKKVALCAIFGSGFGICVLCGVRAKFYYDMKEVDITYNTADFGVWGAIEPLLAIISASLPLLAPVLSRLSSIFILPRWHRSSKGGSNHELRHHRWALSTFGRTQATPRRFRNLDDDLDSHLSAGDTRSLFQTQECSSVDPALQSNVGPHGQIRVTTGWAVISRSRSV